MRIRKEAGDDMAKGTPVSVVSWEWKRKSSSLARDHLMTRSFVNGKQVLSK